MKCPTCTRETSTGHKCSMCCLETSYSHRSEEDIARTEHLDLSKWGRIGWKDEDVEDVLYLDGSDDDSGIAPHLR